ncbi:MAG: hypothetical protein FJW68_08545 [Actinobacteria bacterium]|nr:hypothetical protein [Actinomycetota bacterium]
MAYQRKHKKKSSAAGVSVNSPGRLNNNYWIIFGKCIGWLLLGAAAGYAFFYFFTDFSVNFVGRYKFIQGLFGLNQYAQGSSYIAVLMAIIIGNLVSTIAYFILGYFRLLLPLSIITGFLMIILLFTGSVIRNIPIPAEVIILFCIEAFYRCIALSTGEHLFKNKLENKTVLAVSVAAVIILLLGAAFYEIYQIFGYVF